MKRYINYFLYQFEIFNIIRTPLMYVKKIIQRSTKGYSNEDTWNFDTYLSYIIFNGVKELKGAIGYPIGMKSRKEWYEVLDTISFAFEMKYKLTMIDAIYEEELHNDPLEPYNEKLKWYTENNVYIVSKKDEKRIEKGMKFFIKYFECLWS